MINISLYDQEIFAKRFSEKFNGTIRSKMHEGYDFHQNMECPCCGKKKMVMFAGQRRDTFLVKCPIWGCTLSQTITLSMAIKTYAPEILSEWNIAIGKNPIWGGIQNRRPRGKSLKDKSDGSFREEMEKNAIRQQVKLLMQHQYEKEERFRTFGDSQN